MDKNKAKIGIIGCGMISSAYFKGGQQAPNVDVVACADISRDAARARAAEFSCKALAVDELLADDSIELVINLTVPTAHVEVGLQIVAAGKHAYSEKPLGVDVAEGMQLVAAAQQAGVCLGCAPDTFMGGGQQTVRKLVDAGEIGQPLSGVTAFATPGHERWHANPAFFYGKGGGPMLDMGPYYIHTLVNLLGPVHSVVGCTSRGFEQRVATCEAVQGLTIDVACETHYSGVLKFHNGALITMLQSFDVKAHRLPRFELYGTEGTILVPDPNGTGGEVEYMRVGDKAWREVELAYPENARMIGVVDMIQALRSHRPHRVSGALAMHALEVMCAFEQSSRTGEHVLIKTKPERPAALPEGLKAWEVDA